MLIDIAYKLINYDRNSLPDEHNPALKEKHPTGRVTSDFLEKDRLKHKQDKTKTSDTTKKDKSKTAAAKDEHLSSSFLH